jgi:hypothetical protein
MKPPVFSMKPSGDKAQQYMHRARMFRRAAGELPDYFSSEPYWPKYALLTHAIELSLKAFHYHSIQNGKPSPCKKPKQHDLRGWYQLALQYGLPDEPDVARNIDILNELHDGHYTRYPQERASPVPDASVIADSTVDHLIDTFTQTISPR